MSGNTTTYGYPTTTQPNSSNEECLDFEANNDNIFQITEIVVTNIFQGILIDNSYNQSISASNDNQNGDEDGLVEKGSEPLKISQNTIALWIQSSIGFSNAGQSQDGNHMIGLKKLFILYFCVLSYAKMNDKINKESINQFKKLSEALKNTKDVTSKSNDFIQQLVKYIEKNDIRSSQCCQTNVNEIKQGIVRNFIHKITYIIQTFIIPKHNQGRTSYEIKEDKRNIIYRILCSIDLEVLHKALSSEVLNSIEIESIKRKSILLNPKFIRDFINNLQKSCKVNSSIFDDNHNDNDCVFIHSNK